MTSGSFSDSIQTFAQRRGWEVETGFKGTSLWARSKQTVPTGLDPPAAPRMSAFRISHNTPAERPAERPQPTVHGQPTEECSVSELGVGLDPARVEAKMRSIPGLPAPEPISLEVRRYFGREYAHGSPHWTLPSQTWDYIVLYGARIEAKMAHLTLIRLRPFRPETP